MPSYQQALMQFSLPRLEARLLLCQVSGKSHAGLVSASHDEMPPAQWEAYATLAQQRLAGVPIAYLLGEREFYGRVFEVCPDVLIPRPETEHLIEQALQRLDRTQDLRVADLGTGSGAIAVTLALEAPAWQVHAVDLSRAALAQAARNAAKLGAQVQFHQGSWYQALPDASARFALIVSNPPYIEAQDHHLGEGDVRFEPRMALTDEADGLACLREIIAGAANHLLTQGWLMLEHGYDQGLACRELLLAAGFVAVETIVDLAGNDRVSLGRLP